MLAKAASYIPYSIVLLDSQGCAVPPVPPEKQTPQIWRLAADNRKQFRVRAQGPWKAVMAGRGSGSARLGSQDGFRQPWG